MYIRQNQTGQEFSTLLEQTDGFCNYPSLSILLCSYHHPIALIIRHMFTHTSPEDSSLKPPLTPIYIAGIEARPSLYSRAHYKIHLSTLLSNCSKDLYFVSIRNFGKLIQHDEQADNER